MTPRIIRWLGATVATLALLAIVEPSATAAPTDPLQTATVNAQQVQPAQQHNIVGTWKGKYRVGAYTWCNQTSILRADGTCRSIQEMAGQYVVTDGRYTYSEGVLKVTPIEGLTIETPFMITWQGPNQLTCRGGGYEIVFTRQ